MQSRPPTWVKSLAAFACLTGGLLPGSAAWAQEPVEVKSEAFVARPIAGHSIFELRSGLSNVGPADHPYICAELRPLKRFGFEACGNGAGFLHQANVPDLAHFRGRGTVWEKSEERWSGSAVIGAGLAEVQRRSDRPGFVLGDEGEGAIEAAGPEVSASAQGRYWLDERAYAVVDANVGVAYVPGAPSVIGRGGPVVPFLLVTAGIGF